MTQKAKQSLQGLDFFEHGRRPFPDGEALEWVNKVPVIKGETALMISEEAYRLREASLSVAPPELKEPHPPAEELAIRTYENPIVARYEDKPDFVRRQMEEEKQLMRNQQAEFEHDWLLLHQTQYVHLVERAQHYLNATEQEQFDEFIKKNPVIGNIGP